jgi:hypothetical protein
MAVTVGSTVFWDVTPCRSDIARRFGVTYRLHLQGRREMEARNDYTALQPSRLYSSFVNVFRFLTRAREAKYKTVTALTPHH